MNKINNIAFSNFGLVLSKITGVLDMPSRRGNTTYDWGDYIEPLVHKKDIFWKEKTIKIDVFFDGRRFNKTLEQCLSMFQSLPREFILSTSYGNYTVNLKQVVKSKTYNSHNYALLQLVFYENNPTFLETLPTALGGTGTKIDGYDLRSDFGIIVSKAQFNNELAEAKLSAKTTYQVPRLLTPFRKLKVMQLDCVVPFDTIQELTEKTAKLKKLLSKSGLRILSLKNKNYNCFLTDGFTVNKFDTYVKFTVKLNVDESI